MNSILVVDHQLQRRVRLESIVSQAGFKCVCVEATEVGTAAIVPDTLDATLLAFDLPDDRLQGVLSELSRRLPFVPRIVLTDQGRETIADTAMAIKAGATGCILWATLSPQAIHTCIRGHQRSLRNVTIPPAALNPVSDTSRQSQHSLEQRRREAMERFRLLIDHATDPLWVLEPDFGTDFVVVNQLTCDLLGYRSDEIMHLRAEDVFDASVENLYEVWSRLTPGVPLSVQRRHRRKDGSIVPMEIRLTRVVDADKQFILGQGRDISDRIAAQTALVDSESRYRRLVETVAEGIWVITPQGETSFANEKMASILGCDLSDVIGAPLSKFMFAEDWPAVQGRLKERAAKPKVQYEFRHRKSDGKEGWCSASVSAYFDEAGKHVGTLALCTDITARLHSENQLRETNQTLEALFAHSPLGILALDATLTIVRANPAAVRILEAEQPTLIGQALGAVTRGEPGDQQCPWDAMLAGEVVDGVEIRRRRRDGSELRLRAHVAALRDPDGTASGAVALLADITEQVRLKDSLLQSQKMEAVGRLAGGIAHDFGNLLAVISGYAEAMLRHLPPADGMRSYAEEIERAANHGALLIRQLLAFNRARASARQPLKMAQVFDGLQRMLLYALGERIQLQTHVETGLPELNADRTQLEQILINLALNARDAMPHGGSLRIEAAQVDIQKDEIPALSPGRYLRFRVSDNGTGMDERTRARIFEPFFTTKNNSGTGLGLAIVQGIVAELRGAVRVKSTPGQGTEFEVLLPLES